MDEVERRFQVNCNHGVPLCLAHAQHDAVFGDAGVVDQDVDVAEVLFDLCHHAFGFVEAGCVAGVAFGLHAQGGDFGLGLLANLVDYQVGECDVGAFCGVLECDGFTDATGGASDQRHFSF